MTNVERAPTDIPILSVNGVSIAELIARVAALEAAVADLTSRVEALEGA